MALPDTALLDRYRKHDPQVTKSYSPSITMFTDAQDQHGADVVRRAHKLITEIDAARTRAADPAGRDNGAVVDLHDALRAAEREAVTGNAYLAEVAATYPDEYGFLQNARAKQENEAAAREEFIKLYGEPAVDEANNVLGEIEGLERSLCLLDPAEPEHDPSTGLYSYDKSDADHVAAEQVRANAERQIDAAWQRATSLYEAGNGYIRYLAQSDAELFARAVQVENNRAEFAIMQTAGEDADEIPRHAFGDDRLLNIYEAGLKAKETAIKLADEETGLNTDPTATHPMTGWNKAISEVEHAKLEERIAELEQARVAVPGTWENPIQIGHSIEEQLRYSSSPAATVTDPEPGPSSPPVVPTPDPIPGSPENPIQLGHSVEEQLKYAVAAKEASTRERRVILDSKPDNVEMFRELYQDVVRTGENFPIGSLERHAEGRLQQTYAALVLIEQAQAAGIIPEHSKFVATGAKVQDKRASKEYPAAHRLPADLSIEAADGSLRRLTDYLEVDLDRTWVDKHIFAPTDRIHRLANVADQWVEDGGMKTAFVEAANAVSANKMTAEEALENIVQPGYAAANAKALEKVERNFTLIERQSLSTRIVDHTGRAFREVPEPMALRVKGLDERAAAKDVMERTLKAYSRTEELSADLRMKSGLAVSAIVDNEVLLRERGPKALRELAPGEAMVEARRAAGETHAALTKHIDEVVQLGNKASAAAAAASDTSRPMEARMRAMGDAGAYGEAMKTAWSKLQSETGPTLVKGLSDRLNRCGPHAGAHVAEVRSRLAAPPQTVLDAVHKVDDAQERIQRSAKAQSDHGQDYSRRQTTAPQYSPGME